MDMNGYHWILMDIDGYQCINGYCGLCFDGAILVKVRGKLKWLASWQGRPYAWYFVSRKPDTVDSAFFQWVASEN